MKSAIEAIFARLLSDGTEWRAYCTLQGGGLLNPPACLRSPISTYFQDFTLLLVAVRLPHLQVGVNQEFSKIPKSVKGSAASIRPLLGPLALPGLIQCVPGKGDFQRVIRWKNCSCQPRLLWFPGNQSTREMPRRMSFRPHQAEDPSGSGNLRVNEPRPISCI